jgi:hypothetical protein
MTTATRSSRSRAPERGGAPLARRRFIHRADCSCALCREHRWRTRGRRIEPAVLWACIFVGALAFWAVPGRWLLAAAWRAASPLLGH